MIGEKTDDGYRIILHEIYRSSARAILDLVVVENGDFRELKLSYSIHRFSKLFFKVFTSFLILILGFSVLIGFISAGVLGVLGVLLTTIPMVFLLSLGVYMFKYLFDKEVKKLGNLILKLLE